MTDDILTDAARIIASESLLASMQRAIATTITPLIGDTFKHITTQLDDLNTRVTRLEGHTN